MIRMFLVLVAFALACGQQASDPAGESTPAVDAAIVKEDVESAVGEALPDRGDAEACLRLVGEKNYQDAVTVCAEAAQLAPDNQDVQKALAEAQANAGMPDRGDADACLKLVSEGKYEDAVTVCAEAAQLNPDNTEVTEALATAKRETSAMDNMPDRGDADACLKLVADGKFEDALVVCAEAAQLNPENMQISEALATAKRETSGMPTSAEDAANKLTQ